ncbi:hypothetical protein [Brucella cytisi]|uniref:Uncharacterized protein n=1 Tax=Brucella cytisi TaxID=407152 RepID=A0A1J6HF87_9HYPH|nr:hypothetical protein [Brucella cytisi]OIS91645.1 hypothetical protein BLA27_20320 [Brucella cytisi]
MTKIFNASEITSQYRLVDREISGVNIGDGKVTIWFNLFHVDDPHRNDENMDYPLSIEVKQKEFSVIEGDINDLEKDFSGEILSTVVDGKKLRILADCRFYSDRSSHVIEMELDGDVSVNEMPPKDIT